VDATHRRNTGNDSGSGDDKDALTLVELVPERSTPCIAGAVKAEVSVVGDGAHGVASLVEPARYHTARPPLATSQYEVAQGVPSPTGERARDDIGGLLLVSWLSMERDPRR
jgi:hypothetical protein